MRSVGALLADGLEALPKVREVRGRGLLLGADLDVPASEVVDAARERGLVVLSAAGALRLAPPLTLTEHEAREALGILAEVLA